MPQTRVLRCLTVGALLLAGCGRQAEPPAAAPEAATPSPTLAGTTTAPPAPPAAGTSTGAVSGVPPPLPPGAANATVAAPPTPPAAPAPAPPPPISVPPVDVAEALALIQGASTPLRPGEQTTVDPGATFRVILKGTFPEARLSLLDGADAMQPSAGGREALPAATTVTLQPAAPLKPGTVYRLRIDGATTRELTAKDGTRRGPVEFSILVAGEPPAEPKAKSKKQKKRP